MQLPPTELLREAAERNLARLEDQVADAVTKTMRAWLQAVGFLVIREVLQQHGITAAGYAQPTGPSTPPPPRGTSGNGA